MENTITLTDVQIKLLLKLFDNLVEIDEIYMEIEQKLEDCIYGV